MGKRKQPSEQQTAAAGERQRKSDDSEPEPRESGAAATPEATSAKMPAGDNPSATGNEVSELMQKLDELGAEREDYRQRLLRSVADFENYRRRMTREKDEVRTIAAAALVEDLLPVLDNLKLGLVAAREHHPEAKAVLDGVEMVETQLQQILKRHGLEEINPLGANFDPNFHEAVSHQPSDRFSEGTVSLVQRIGYRFRDRLVRPASVIVSSGPGPGDAGRAEKESPAGNSTANRENPS